VATSAALALGLLSGGLAGPARGASEDDAERKAIERENERRAKAGLLPRKEPPRPPGALVPAPSAPPRSEALPAQPVAPASAPPAGSAQATSAAPPPALARPASTAAPQPPRRTGPLDAVVSAARGLSPAGAYGGPEVAIDEGLTGTFLGLSVRSTLRVRAGDVALVVEPAR
jgi:hypothetical protein